MPITPITPSGSNAPNDLPSDAAGAVAVPNTLPSDAAGAVAVPNTLPADGAGSVASPVSLPSVAAAAAPRTLTPMVNLDFAAKSYARKGRTVLFDDLLTYTRPSSATFINRRPDVDGGYEYFLDTDYVGDVTNLVTYSEDFSNSDWSKSATSVQSNVVDSPYSNFTADKLILSSTSGNILSTVTTSNESIASVYVKIGSNITSLQFRDGNGGAYSFFNLSGGDFIVGVSTTNQAYADYIKDGWWKLSIVVSSFTSGFRIALNGSAGGFVYIWGAQLTESAKPLPYVKTLASAVTQTFTETLRVEYDAATGNNLGALIEGGSTNLCKGSENIIAGSAFSILRTSVTTNTSIAPDGTFSAGKLIPSTEDDSHFVIVTQSTVLAPSKASISFYVKPAGHNFFQIASGQTAIEFATFDLQSGTISETGSATNESECSISPVGNGFYRVSVFIQPSATGTTYSGSIPSGTLGWRPSFTGDGVSGVYVWGAQFEALPFASSYIRTEGSAVSRSADSLNLPVTSIPAPSLEQSVVVNFDIHGRLLNDRVYEIGGVNSGRRHIYIPTSGTELGYRYQNVSTTTELLDDKVFKTVSSFDGTSVKFYSNKELAFSMSPTELGNSSTVFKIGANTTGASPMYGHISKFKTYAQALTAQEITLL